MKSFPKLKISAILVLLIAVFFILNLTGFSKTIKNFFYSVSSPVEKKLWQTGKGFSDFWGTVFEKKNLKIELDSLRQKNEELLAQIVFLAELRKENEFLREALNIGLQKDFRIQLVQIVQKDPSKDSILIDKGSKDGISKGFPVITSQKTLAGRIGEVYNDFSEVVLISSKNSVFDAKISEKEIYGVVKGQGSSELYLDLIPKDKEISRGDLVVTAALGRNFPPGILVGEIEEVKNLDAEPFQTAKIKSSFKMQELNSLFVIINFPQ